MHDMNPFTGGCHYSSDRTRFIEGCGPCPHLGSSETGDVTAVIHETKSKAYRQLSENQLTVVTPSTWLGEVSKQSSLMGRFAHHVIPYGLDLNVFRPKNRRVLREKLGIGKSENVILMLSDSLESKRKGMDLLHQAVQTTKIERSLCLLTVGSGRVPEIGIKSINMGALCSDE